MLPERKVAVIRIVPLTHNAMEFVVKEEVRDELETSSQFLKRLFVSTGKNNNVYG